MEGPDSGRGAGGGGGGGGEEGCDGDRERLGAQGIHELVLRPGFGIADNSLNRRGERRRGKWGVGRGMRPVDGTGDVHATRACAILYSMASANKQTGYEAGRDNVEFLGLEVHKPVFFVSCSS